MQNTFFTLGLRLVVVTGIFGTIYVSGQLITRQSANYPQIAIANDMVAALKNNIDAQAAVERVMQVAPETPFDVANDQLPFVIVYDSKGGVVTSGVELDGSVPTPPKGVFDYAKEHEINRVTWAPRSSVRLAAVVEAYDGGYVVVARSLKHNEEITSDLAFPIGVGWIISLILVGLMSANLKGRRVHGQ